jgi:hypothetical protein
MTGVAIRVAATQFPPMLGDGREQRFEARG